MEYMTYGRECILFIISLLVISHLILELLPLLCKSLRDAFLSSPVDFSSRVALILAAWFLL